MKNKLKCTLDQHQSIVNSLYYQIQAANNDYASLMMKYSYIQEIQSLLVNDTFDIEINQLSFDVIINETTTPSSFPLKIAFDSQVMDYIYELTVVVDHNTPLTVINRDIAEAILNVKDQITSNRKKRDCTVVDPEHNEKMYEQYCTKLDNIKEYFTELNATFNTIVEFATDNKLNADNLVTYNLLRYKDKDEIPIDIDTDIFNTYIDEYTNELLNMSLTSMELSYNTLK